MIAKVCGLRSAAEVRLALAAGADLLGFLQHPASPRHCPELALARLAGARAVLVMVAGDAAALLAGLAESGAGWVQPYLPPVHRDPALIAQRAELLSTLRARGRKVLLPWPDEPGQAVLPADLYLWETSARATGVLGGSGQAHGLCHPPPGPFLLAGGLSGPVLAPRLQAMPAALRAACRGFDAASGLAGSGGGFQDPQRVRAFVASAHALTCSE